jgi:hypothetical protein
MGRGWEGGGQFTSNLGPRWAESHHAKEGFQVSKREWKGSNRELARGVKTRGLRHNNVVNLYTCIEQLFECLSVVNNLNCV